MRNVKMRPSVFPIAVIIIVAAGLLFIPSCASAVNGSSPDNPGFTTVITPFVTCTTSSSTVVHWYPDTMHPDFLFFANDSYYVNTGSYDHSIAVRGTNPRATSVLLNGLEPGIRYHFTLISKGKSTQDQSFLSFPLDGSCSFIVYGDTREQAPYFTQTERHKIVADRIADEPNISFVINVGDLVSNPDDSEEWNRFFTAGKRLFATTTYAVVRGNHDSNLSLFQDLFGNDGVYSFDCGDAHIVVLDSNDDAGYSLEEQARWLKTDLDSSGKWKIVILHHPLFTSEENHYGGFENLQKTFEPVFQSENVSAVFNGHVHAYERMKKSGVTYITEGRGGAPAYRLSNTKIEGSVMSRENSLGYSRITISPVTESLQIDVVQVADVSSDLRNITRIFPPDTIIDRVEFDRAGQQSYRRSVISKSFSFFPGLLHCKESSVSSNDIPREQFSICIPREMRF